jgi:hypothetical protein
MSSASNGKTTTKVNFDQLVKSIERLSLYDAKGKAKPLHLPAKLDLSKLVGNLDLDGIQERMWVNQR